MTAAKSTDPIVAKFEERLEWYKNRGSTRKLAIHAFCYHCAGSTRDAKECPCKDCILWPFRLGSDSTPELKKEADAELRKRKSKATKMNRGPKAEDG